MTVGTPRANSWTMKRLDIPPNWLLGFMALAYAQSLVWDGGGGAWVTGLGYVLVVAGLGLAIWAFRTMTAARTTPVPHREPSALVTSGPFGFTRNPIYLADVVILLGVVVICRAWASLVLVPLLASVIERRFIEAEEARCEAAFGAEWAAYAGRVRRWL